MVKLEENPLEQMEGYKKLNNIVHGLHRERGSPYIYRKSI